MGTDVGSGVGLLVAIPTRKTFLFTSLRISSPYQKFSLSVFLPDDEGLRDGFFMTGLLKPRGINRLLTVSRVTAKSLRHATMEAERGLYNVGMEGAVPE